MAIEPMALTLRRWSLCRCVYARGPTDHCRCTPETLARAARETAEQTRRWERRLNAEGPHGD